MTARHAESLQEPQPARDSGPTREREQILNEIYDLEENLYSRIASLRDTKASIIAEIMHAYQRLSEIARETIGVSSEEWRAHYESRAKR